MSDNKFPIKPDSAAPLLWWSACLCFGGADDKYVFVRAENRDRAHREAILKARRYAYGSKGVIVPFYAYISQVGAEFRPNFNEFKP